VTRSSLLRDRGVRALVSAETISMAGSQMTYIVLPWFVLITTGSPARMSVVVAAEMLPVALFGLASGAVTARIGARRTMLICDASRSILLAAIPTLHLMGMLSFAGLVGLVFLVGIFMVPHASAQRVIVPELVGEDATRVGETQSLLQAGLAISSVAGPALGGILIAVLGETNVLYIDAASYAVSFVLLGIWVRPAEAAPDDSNEPRGVLDGVRFLFRDRLLRAWMLSITGINVVWSALGVVLPVLVLERYGDRPEVLGYVFGAFGLGSVFGALASLRIIGRVDGLLLATSASAGQTVALWLLFPDLPWPALAAAGAAVGLFFPILNSVVVTTRTMRTPPRLRPAVHTAAVTVAMILSPLGALAAGPALGVYGLKAVLAVVLAANTLLGITFAAAGVREHRAPSGAAASLT
jgi:predicted MFS family arabinose efflux permease